MDNIELRITKSDWFSVLLIGTLFATLLSVFGYYLLGFDPLDGVFFGLILGFLITLFSLFFITMMNRYILPKIQKRFWNLIAALFSFLSGFLGALSTYYLLKQYSIAMIPMFESQPYQNTLLIGVLTYLIGALMYRFVKARNQKEHADRLYVQSRVRSLETQLNPHFLYNALNSIAELIHQDRDKAEESLLKMSDFLRNTMKESPLISLREELHNVQSYIDLENIRFGGMIVLNVECDELTKGVRVPKFSIQLLCENAIKHGLGNTVGSFSISIRIYRDELLHVDVSNSGKEITNSVFGIGLSNLQERLNHLCSGKLSITGFAPPIYTLTLKECDENLDC
jgi:sensor histidine kinase YesM